jgi:hypothetical protein
MVGADVSLNVVMRVGTEHGQGFRGPKSDMYGRASPKGVKMWVEECTLCGQDMNPNSGHSVSMFIKTVLLDVCEDCVDKIPRIVAMCYRPPGTV